MHVLKNSPQNEKKIKIKKIRKVRISRTKSEF
jgi:hypothetical protein